ncbi:MAG TPA: TraR/DksA C4-type zinc finger protein [Phycisphaerae bacterium]|nr:TraR/DksA C4-type zinc finger protein [Phycisphaerae bacterium]
MAQKTTKKSGKKAPLKKTPPKAPASARRDEPRPKPKARPEPKAAHAPARKAAPEAAPAKGHEKKEKASAGLSRSDLQYFRNLLLEKRREILGDVGSMESEAFKGGSNLSNMPIHMADVGTDNFEQEFTLGLIESERQILREIQDALARVDDGSFGICQGTGKPIPRVRLEAVPWAKYTIEYSRLLEQGKISREPGQAAEDDSSDEDEE